MAPEAKSIFKSKEFGSFLESVSSSTLSKNDAPLRESSLSSVFRSKDHLSNLFSSGDWEMGKIAPEDPVKTAPELVAPDDIKATAYELLKQYFNSGGDSATPDAPASVTPDTFKAAVPAPPSMLKSLDWISRKTLGNPAIAPITPSMFDEAATAAPEPVPSAFSSRDWMSSSDVPDQDASFVPSMFGGGASESKTDWDEEFFSQLLASPSAQCEVTLEESAAAAAEALLDDSIMEGARDPPANVVPAPREATDAVASAKRRSRAPRKKVLPDVKTYVEPCELDVLLGRGGRSNHWPGNVRYREEISDRKTMYSLVGREEKTDLAQELVNYVGSYGGRFLEHDAGGWYVVANITARRKAGQALREDSDPEKRKAKRRRFLMRRAAKATSTKE